MKPNTAAELENPLCECANCGLRNKANDLNPTHDIWSRIQPGEVLPHGDCPECGAFCYPIAEPEKRPTIHEAMERLLKCAELNQDSLEPETVAAIKTGYSTLAEGLTVRLFTLSSRARLSPVNRPEIRLFKIEPGVIPPDPDGQNDDRADWAGQCIELFQKLTRCDEEDAVHDLITDLAHWCDRQGSVDFNDELNHAANMYHEETAEP